MAHWPGTSRSLQSLSPQRIGAVVRVQCRHKKVKSRRAGKRVGIPHCEFIIGNRFGDRFDVDGAVGVNERIIFGFGDYNSGHVAHESIGYLFGLHTACGNHLAPQFIGRRVCIRHVFARLDVIGCRTGSNIPDFTDTG